MSRSSVAQNGPDPIDVHVGLAIRARRVNADMTQTDLGKAIGVTFQQVQKYEKGMNRVSASMMVRCAEAVGCGVGDFFPTLGKINSLDEPPIGTVKGGRELNRLYAQLSAAQRGLVLDLVRELSPSSADR